MKEQNFVPSKILLNALPGFFYRATPDSQRTLTGISGQCEALTGYSPEEVLENAGAIFSARSPLAQPEGYEDSKTEVYPILTKQGATKWVKDTWIPVTGHSTNDLYLEGYITEISTEESVTDFVYIKDFYESIINNINIDIAVFDMDNRFRFLSKSTIKDDEFRQWLIGKTNYDYCIARNKDLSLADSREEKHEEVNRTGDPVEWIEELKDSQGNRKYYLRILKPFYDKKNSPFKVGFGFDITRLKLAEEELQHRENLLKFSHRLAKIGYWTRQLVGNKNEWSDGIYEILEIPRDDRPVSRQLFEEMIHPEDKDFYFEQTREANFGEKTISVVIRIITANGNVKYVKVDSPGNLNKGNLRFGVIQDITEIKRSQEALAKSEQHFKAITENSPIGITEFDLDLKVIYFNGKHTVDSQEAGPQTHLFSLVAPVHHSLLLEKINDTISSGKINELELKGLSPEANKSSEWTHITIGAIRDSQGKVDSILLLTNNISEKKRHEEDREKLIREINHKYNELMQFNYIVSHNLRSPVANILAMSYLLNTPMEQAEQQQIFDYIVKSAESLDNVIRDLNNVLSSRSPINEKIEKVSLSDIIDSVLYNLDNQVQASGAEISVLIEEAAKEFSSIKSYVHSALYNLVSNSIKYQSKERALEIRISAKNQDGIVSIRVADNGLGIDLEKNGQHLFGLYKRFHRNVDGKGLGLHMTKAQLESIGGSISVQSKPGQGAEFLITLPAGERTAEDIPSSQNP